MLVAVMTHQMVDLLQMFQVHIFYSLVLILQEVLVMLLKITELGFIKMVLQNNYIMNMKKLVEHL